MKSIYFSFVLAGLFLINSCSQKGDVTPPDTVASGAEWKLNGTNYKGSVSTVAGNQLMGSDGTNSIQLFFKSLPTNASSNFSVVDEYNAPAGSLSSNQCAFEVNVGANDVYLSKKEVTDSIDVTLTSGKFFALSFGTYKMDHYTLSGNFIDSTSTCTLVSLKQ